MFACSRFAQSGTKVRKRERCVPSSIAVTKVTLQHIRDSLDHSPGEPRDHVRIKCTGFSRFPRTRVWERGDDRWMKRSVGWWVGGKLVSRWNGAVAEAGMQEVSRHWVELKVHLLEGRDGVWGRKGVWGWFYWTCPLYTDPEPTVAKGVPRTWVVVLFIKKK